MDQRRLGRQGPMIRPLGYGAFKIGRNIQTKYSEAYDLPDEAAVSKLLNEVLDIGINYIDTAPAYGLSEERIGRSISSRRTEFILSTKVGEFFENGRSRYDYSEGAVKHSLAESLRRLRTDVLDVVFVHSNGDDIKVLEETDVVATLQQLQVKGDVRQIGFSGKTINGARKALCWAECLMVEYHLDDRSHSDVIHDASAAGVGVIIKKPLASGRLSAIPALRFVLETQGVSAAVMGSLRLENLKECQVSFEEQPFMTEKSAGH